MAADPRVTLAPGVLLQAGGAEPDATLQLASGERVQLNALARRILLLCDGTRSAKDIAAEVARGGTPQNVLDFLSSAAALGWVVTLRAR